MRGIRLSIKLPLIIILALLLIVSSCTLMTIFLVRKVLRTQTIEANINSAQTYARAIEFYIDSARSVLETTAHVSRIRDFSSAQFIDPNLHGIPENVDRPKRDFTQWLMKHSKVFEDIKLLTPDGTVYLLEPYELQIKLSHNNLSYTAWYKKLMNTGQTVVSDLHISVASQRPTIVIATPLHNNDHQIIGIWAAALKLDELSQIGHGGLEVGPLQRYGYVTDQKGLVIAHQANLKEVIEQTDLSSVPLVRAALSGQSGVSQFVDPISGVEKLGAYVSLPDHGWAVVYEQATEAAFAPLSYLTRMIALISTAAIILLALVSIAIVRQITIPLGQLTASAGAIGAGDLTQRLTVARNDEVGRLAEEFNRMTAALLEKETQLKDHANRLETSNKELEAFSYSVSHDLRAPLRAIDGFSRILLEEHSAQLSSPAMRYLNLVRSNAQKMGRLIDDLLAFSRLNRQNIKIQSVVLSELVQQTLQELRSEQEGRELEIEIGHLPVCQADPALLRQVLANLLSNALKYTRKQPKGKIEVGSQEDEKEYIVFIKDNGVGFDMRYAHKLFGVFQRFHRAEEYEGTGVGLAIVQRIVLRHGGRVWAEAEVNKGATFYFAVPKGDEEINLNGSFKMTNNLNGDTKHD